MLRIREEARPCIAWQQDWSGKTVILHTNDIHGRILKGEDGSLGIGTVIQLKQVIQKLGGEVILLDAGDTLIGTKRITNKKGAVMVALMNLAGYDAMVCGNHDFEYGTKHLIQLADQMEFPLLGANVIERTSNQIVFNSRLIIEKNGVTYGIFGLVTEATMLLSKEENVQNIIMIDPVLSARMEVACLKAAGADIIIALTHLGMIAKDESNALDVIQEVEDIDIVIDGHSHSTLEECQSVNVCESVIYSSAGRYLNEIGMIVIDENQKMTAYSLSEEDIMELFEETTY